MKKSVHSQEYQVLLDLLKETRTKRGVTQSQLAEALGITQSVVSKCERGERRMDVVELRAWCLALSVSFVELVCHLDEVLKE